MNAFGRCPRPDSVSSLARQWSVLRQRLPKGFEKFFNRHGKPSPSKEKTESLSNSKGLLVQFICTVNVSRFLNFAYPISIYFHILWPIYVVMPYRFC